MEHQAISSVYVLQRMKGAESFGAYADQLLRAAEKALKATLSLRPLLFEKTTGLFREHTSGSGRLLMKLVRIPRTTC